MHVWGYASPVDVARASDDNPCMRPSTQLRSIGDLKANARQIVNDVSKSGEPLVITDAGRAKAVLIDIESHERAQQTMALLKILALGQQQVSEGKVRPARKTVAELRKRIGAK